MIDESTATSTPTTNDRTTKPSCGVISNGEVELRPRYANSAMSASPAITPTAAPLAPRIAPGTGRCGPTGGPPGPSP